MDGLPLPLVTLTDVPSEAVIRRLRKTITCSICLDFFQDVCLLSTCGHSFCTDCITTNLRVSKLCPMCKTLYNQSSIVQMAPINQVIDNFVRLIFESGCEAADRGSREGPNPLSGANEIRPSDLPPSRSGRNQQEQCADSQSNDAQPLEASRRHNESNEFIAESFETLQSVGNFGLLGEPIPIQTTVPPTTPPILFEKGQFVNVMPRCWIGINKPGGPAVVVSRHDEISDSGTVEAYYDVKYLLHQGQDHGVPALFVEKMLDVERKERRSRLSSSSPNRSPQGLDAGTSRKDITTRSSEGDSATKIKKRKPLAPVDRNIMSSSNEPNEKRRTLVTQSSVPARKPVVILSSGLSDEDHSKLDEFGEKFGFSITHRFDSLVTHLVVPVDRNNRFRQRTMKYMQCIMGKKDIIILINLDDRCMSAGCWIVCQRWVQSSLKRGVVQEEHLYEISGSVKAVLEDAPKRSREEIREVSPMVPVTEPGDDSIERLISINPLSTSLPFKVLSSSRRFSNLFAKYAVLLYGAFPSPGPPRSQLEELLCMGSGALVTSRISEFLYIPSSTQTKVVVVSDLENKSNFIMELEHAASQVTVQDLKFVTPLWILDAATNYCVPPVLVHKSKDSLESDKAWLSLGTMGLTSTPIESLVFDDDQRAIELYPIPERCSAI